MKLLVINSNMNREITDKIREVSRRLANPGTTVDVICAEWGVPVIEGNYDAAFAALATVDLVRRHEKNYDAFVIACYCDPGLYAARELTNKPVYGIAQASMLAACSFGHRFSILSPLARFKPVLESLVRYYGLEALCASVRTVDMDVKQSFDDLKAANTAFAREARRAVEEDGAEVICLGGAVFAVRKRQAVIAKRRVAMAVHRAVVAQTIHPLRAQVDRGGSHTDFAFPLVGASPGT